MTLFQDDVFIPPVQQSYTLDPHRKVGSAQECGRFLFSPVPSLPFLSQVPLMNGQMGPPGRPPMSQTPMARHPSREQLIDYLMLKVSHQGQAPPRIPPDTVQHEVGKVKVLLKVPWCQPWRPCM